MRILLTYTFELQLTSSSEGTYVYLFCNLPNLFHGPMLGRTYVFVILYISAEDRFTYINTSTPAGVKSVIHSEFSSASRSGNAEFFFIL